MKKSFRLPKLDFNLNIGIKNSLNDPSLNIIKWISEGFLIELNLKINR